MQVSIAPNDDGVIMEQNMTASGWTAPHRVPHPRSSKGREGAGRLLVRGETNSTKYSINCALRSAIDRQTRKLSRHYYSMVRGRHSGVVLVVVFLLLLTLAL